MTSAGELDRQVQLQSYTTSTNLYNEMVQGFSTYATVWAKMEFHQANENEESGRQYAQMDLYFTIRWRSGLEPDHQLVFEDKTYRIVGRPREIDRRRFLKIQASLVE
jgi:SPP1 family predicted phage head-tail adaptor